MASLRSLIERRSAVKTELQAILAQHPDTLPDDAQARWDALTGEADGLENRIAMQARVDEVERRVAGTPAGGGAPSRPEVRVFAGAPTATPEGFDGTVLRTQGGERVPVLEARHRLADFLPQTESRAAAAEL